MSGRLASLLLPPVCLGCGRLLRHDQPLALCSRCRPLQAELPATLAERGGVWARWDYDGPLQRAIVALKFGGQLAVAGPLGRLLAADPRLRNDAEGRPWELVAPVSLHWRRRLLRGFDQSEALTRWALRWLARGGQPGPRLAPRLLRRRRATRPQTELPAGARARNVARAFEARRGVEVAGRAVLVVDDVTTTGATLAECMRCLSEAGASRVGGLALLRTPR